MLRIVAAAPVPWPNCERRSSARTRATTSRARHLCVDTRVPWLADPLLYRTALEGYRTPSSLQDLDHTPGRDGNPYLVEEFEAADLTNMVGR